MRTRLKHVDSFVDRHGKAHFYFRRGHGKRIPLPGLVGSREFMAAYQVALSSDEPSAAPRLHGSEGTFDRLVASYFASPEFLTMKESTRRAYRPVIERWVEWRRIGHRLVSQMTREHVKRMVAKRASTPGAANDLLKKIRLLMTFAIDANMRTDNPASKIKKFSSGEFHSWSDDEIARFEARWPIGARQRLAFALHLFTGQRTSDVCRMSWADIDDEALIRVVQLKTGVKMWVPLHRSMRAILAQTKREHHALLFTAQGRPFTTKGLGNYMADSHRCREFAGWVRDARLEKDVSAPPCRGRLLVEGNRFGNGPQDSCRS